MIFQRPKPWPLSDHFDGRRFVSPYGGAPKALWDVLRWKLFGKKPGPWPKWVENRATPQILCEVPAGHVQVTFINHATVLLQWPGLNVLTDPVWSQRVSPFSFVGPKRVRPPGLAFEKLPKIDVVVVSHNHYDHLDQKTLQRLWKDHDPLFFMGLGDARHLRLKDARVQELDWWQSAQLPNGAKIHYVPAQHWSARGLFDRNASLWGGFVMEGPGGGVIYFAGDTGYSTHFQEIARLWPRMDLALLPIGAYEPRWFMKSMHMNPADAVQAHLDLGARRSMAIHFGTWHLTDETMDQPVMDLREALRSQSVRGENFLVLENGASQDLLIPDPT